jgi:hypothetical protein
MENRITDVDYLQTGVVTDEVLRELCRAYLPEIREGKSYGLPRITVRYVKKNNEFGYTGLENCFFYDDDFYVWEQDRKWEDARYQDIAGCVFQDACEGRGYAHKTIFAGVNTHFHDSRGEEMFTGDVILVDQGADIAEELALGAFPDRYCFILDNQRLELDYCCENFKLTRIGTIFYQLNLNEFPVKSLKNRTLQFNLHERSEEELSQKLLMAKYTPNFDQDFWMYQALEVLGSQYHWRKCETPNSLHYQKR